MTGKFPKAEPIKPLYEIDKVIHKRVPAADAMGNPDAIRAAVEIRSGPDKGGTKIGWFLRLSEPVE